MSESNLEPRCAGISNPIPANDTLSPAVESTLDFVESAVESLLELDQPKRGRATPNALGLTVSIVIPVFNEVDTIREIVRQVRAQELHCEILIVDDYSTDGTRDILLELDRDPDIRVFFHGYNQGKGAALRTAFERVQGDTILIQDADLEYDPSDYRVLLEPIAQGDAEVVYGSRFLQNPTQDPSRFHRFGNWLLTFASNRMTGQRLTDMETCYKVFRRSALHALHLKQDRFGFEPEITAKLSRLGIKIHEVPIRYQARDYHAGKKIGLRDAFSALWCIVRYRFGN